MVGEQGLFRRSFPICTALLTFIPLFEWGDLRVARGLPLFLSFSRQFDSHERKPHAGLVLSGCPQAVAGNTNTPRRRLWKSL